MLRFAGPLSSFLCVCLVLGHPGSAAEPPTAPRPLPTTGEAKILAALGQPTVVDFADHPLSDVADFLKRKHQIEIQLDNKALTDAGVGSDTPITMQLGGITLRSLLRLMLRELDLTYVVRDGFLLITSKTEAENILRVKVYPVADLVSDSEFRPRVRAAQNVVEDYSSLTNLITSTVAPTTWDEGTGPGSIKVFDNSHTISFAQTEEVHEEAAELLDTLRSVRDQQLAAARALPRDAQAQRPGEEHLQTYVYRLVPRPMYLPWPWPWNVGGMGMGGMGMGGGMGGGMYRVADETAAADAKPADATATSNTPPSTKPEPEEADKSSSMLAKFEWDDRQCDEWRKELAGSLPTLVEPESWQPRGEGSIRLLTGALVVRQTREVQEKINRFLAELLPLRVVTSTSAEVLSVRMPMPGPRLDWPTDAEPRPIGNAAQMEEALGKECNLDFHDEPLVEAIKSLAAQGPLKLWLDQKALTDAGVGTDTPVRRTIHGVTLRAAFKLLLSELDLAYVMRNEVFMITSKTEAESMLVTKVYPVFDLVASPRGASTKHMGWPFRPIDAPSGMAAWPSCAYTSDYRTLIENIDGSIAPATWDNVGGPGAIEEFVNSGALVISQTTEVHEEIAAYLKALREAAVAQR